MADGIQSSNKALTSAWEGQSHKSRVSFQFQFQAFSTQIYKGTLLLEAVHPCRDRTRWSSKTCCDWKRWQLCSKTCWAHPSFSRSLQLASYERWQEWTTCCRALREAQQHWPWWWTWPASWVSGRSWGSRPAGSWTRPTPSRWHGRRRPALRLLRQQLCLRTCKRTNSVQGMLVYSRSSKTRWEVWCDAGYGIFFRWRIENVTYLWDTSPVVTVDDVDKTFFPATSTASQIFPVWRQQETKEEMSAKVEKLGRHNANNLA